jgi:hypothetical protein
MEDNKHPIVQGRPLESYSFAIVDFENQTVNGEKFVPPVYNELKEYDIWMEGYAATGESSKASYLGKSKGRNFQDACMRYALKSELEHRQKMDNENQYFDTGRWDYDPRRNSIWACRLYETEDEARESFG